MTHLKIRINKCGADDHRDHLYLFTCGVICHLYYRVWVTFTEGTTGILDKHGANMQLVQLISDVKKLQLLFYCDSTSNLYLCCG